MTLLPLHHAQHSLLTAAGEPIGVLLLDCSTGALHARCRPDLDDRPLARWAEEIPQVARELGGEAYLSLLEDRLSNAVEITAREDAAVRDFPAAAERLYRRRVLGESAPAGQVPRYSLRAAAGRFGQDMEAEPEGHAALPAGVRFSPELFAVHIQGRSMEPEVPDGATAVFRVLPAGSRQGKRVLVWRRGASESGGEFTLKVYSSRKRSEGDGWEHDSVTLSPLNPGYPDLELDRGGEYRVLGELVAVLALEDLL